MIDYIPWETMRYNYVSMSQANSFNEAHAINALYFISQQKGIITASITMIYSIWQ